MDQITHMGQNLLESSSFSQSIAPLGSSDSKNNHLFHWGKKNLSYTFHPRVLALPLWQYQVIELVFHRSRRQLSPCRISYSSLIQMYPIMSRCFTARNLRPYVTTLREVSDPKGVRLGFYTFQALHCFPINATFLKQSQHTPNSFTISTEQPSEMYHSIQKQLKCKCLWKSLQTTLQKETQL